MLTVILWSGTSVAIKFTVDTLPPIAVAGLRFTMASMFMFGWCRWRGETLALQRSDLALPCLVGGIMFLQIWTFTLGVHWSNSSHGTLLIHAFIFLVILIEHFVTLADRLTGRKVCGLVLATFGMMAALVASGSETGQESVYADADRPQLLGDVLVLMSAVILSIKIVVIKYGVERMGPGKLIFWQDIVCVFLFAICSGVFEGVTPWQWENFTQTTILALLYQGVVVAGLCFAIQAMLLRRYSASQISVFSFSTPLFGVAYAVLLRNDPLSPWLIASGLGVALGIYLTNRKVIST